MTKTRSAVPCWGRGSSRLAQSADTAVPNQHILEAAGRPNVVADEIRLLGIAWGYIQDWEHVRGKTGRPVDTGPQVKANTGMMAVVPAWHLVDLLNRPDAPSSS
jgi:hypothetical protein